MVHLKKTPLFDVHVAAGAKMVPFAGWDMPVQYAGLVKEHEAVRERAGLFDVSHMGEVEIEGPESVDLVNRLVVGDVTELEIGKVLYSLMCYENGGVVDDLLVYRRSNDQFLLVINAGNIDKDVAWIMAHAENFQVQAVNRSNEYAQLAIQGPLSQQILQKITEAQLDEIGFFQFKEAITVADTQALVSRTGYTGEDGFEIYCKPHEVESIWTMLLEVGANDGLEPAGLGARDTLRFEANLPLYGHEIDQDVTPLEAGLSYFVDLNSGGFIGHDALVKQKEDGLELKLVGFEMIDKGIPRNDYNVLHNGDVIGKVTTGYKAPTVGKVIGLALVDIDYTRIGIEIDIDIRGKLKKAIVVSKQFYKKKYKK